MPRRGHTEEQIMPPQRDASAAQSPAPIAAL